MRMNGMKGWLPLFLIVLGYLVFSFLVKLFQHAAAEPLSIETIFSWQNLIETAVLYGTCAIVVLLAFTINRKRKRRNDAS